MQHVNANDFMTGSAKRAIDTAIGDARRQVVGGGADAAPSAPGGARPTPEAARPAPGAPR